MFCQFIQVSKQTLQHFAAFCVAISGFAKRLSSNGQLWIVTILVRAFQFTYKVVLCRTVISDAIPRVYLMGSEQKSNNTQFALRA